MKPTPPDWPRFASSIFYQDAKAAIDWLCRAFGFTVRIKVEGDDGKIVHSELEYGDGLIMVSQEGVGNEERVWKRLMRSPKSLGGCATHGLLFFVDDADAHCAHARAQGARILAEPENQDYGAEYWTDRSYCALDPEDHIWWVTQRLRTAGETSR